MKHFHVPETPPAVYKTSDTFLHGLKISPKCRCGLDSPSPTPHWGPCIVSTDPIAGFGDRLAAGRGGKRQQRGERGIDGRMEDEKGCEIETDGEGTKKRDGMERTERDGRREEKKRRPLTCPPPFISPFCCCTASINKLPTELKLL